MKKIFGPERQEVTGEDCLMRSFIICKVIKSGRMKCTVNVMQSFSGRQETNSVIKA
jgi:hypothetical protein